MNTYNFDDKTSKYDNVLVKSIIILTETNLHIICNDRVTVNNVYVNIHVDVFD